MASWLLPCSDCGGLVRFRNKWEANYAEETGTVQCDTCVPSRFPFPVYNGEPLVFRAPRAPTPTVFAAPSIDLRDPDEIAPAMTVLEAVLNYELDRLDAEAEAEANV